jgi:diguanylate cyclase (GGDEF)-like protein/PAS domain S-box-containing protein
MVEERPAVLDLQAMLDLLADTVVKALGFAVAAVNLVESPHRVVVVSVAGPDEVRDRLLQTSDTLENWERLLAAGQPWGRLVFLDHATVNASLLTDGRLWTPQMAASHEPDAWHPEDCLFAPLRASDGAILGILSVDLPRGGRRPDAETRKSLEAFGVSAALAIEHATLRARAEQSEELFREVFNASPVGMALLDVTGAIVVGNEALLGILHRTPAELTGRELSEFRHPEDRRRLSDQVGLPKVDGPRGGERFVRGDGSTIWVEVTQTYLHAGQVVAQVRDVTEQREAVNRLQHMATHDPVTGVGNRSMLLETMRKAITSQAASRSQIALLFIDLDGFKRVNDDFSHAVGDEVLRAVAQRLLAVVRPHDCVVRWGGDEFIVMVHPLHDKQAALDLTERIAASLSTPFGVGDIETTVASSIGVAFSDPDDVLDVEELLRNADTAMYRAKREGKSSFAIFDGDIGHWSAQSQHVERLLADAAQAGRVVVHYQPIIRIADGSVAAVEALMRLRDDDGGLLYPESFLSTARETGHLAGLEDVALRSACGALANWSRLGFPLRLSLNVEVGLPGELEALERRVRAAVCEFGISARSLTFEINEQSLHQAEPPTLRGLPGLVDSGLNFSIDGFGSGFDSLKYLRTMPISEIKIDRGFIQEAPNDKVAAAVVRAHAALAQELDIRCIAKGVETREQDAFLQATGIKFAQGFLYEQPLRREAVTEFLAHRARLLASGDTTAEPAVPPRVEDDLPL